MVLIVFVNAGEVILFLVVLVVVVVDIIMAVVVVVLVVSACSDTGVTLDEVVRQVLSTKRRTNPLSLLADLISTSTGFTSVFT